MGVENPADARPREPARGGVMRILIPTGQWFPEATGGSARVATETALALVGRGHEVTVIAPAGAGPAVEEVVENLTIRRSLPRTRLPITLTDVVSTARAARRDSTVQGVLAHTASSRSSPFSSGSRSNAQRLFSS